MISLLDVNVLIALLWPPHKSHAKAQRWFLHNAAQGWATCAMTQAGFVRIVSNPDFSENAVSPRDALVVLNASLEHSGHIFWREDLDLPSAMSRFGRRILGHQQVTDAYLLGLAIHKKGRLVSLDASLSSLTQDDAVARTHLTLL